MSSIFRHRISKLVFVAVMITIVVDTQIFRIFGFINERSSATTLVIFGITAIVFALWQYTPFRLFSQMLNKSIIVSKQHFILRWMHKGISISQHFLLALLVIAFLQIIIVSSYNMLILEAALCTSYFLSLVLIGFLSYRFFMWFKFNHDPVVFSYALAMVVISANALFTPLYIIWDLQNVPLHVQALKQSGMPFSSADNLFYNSYIVTSVMSFILTWFATVLLLHHYSNKFGRVKYWIIISLPLIYFIGPFQLQFLELFYDIRLTYPVIFNLIYTIAFSVIKPAGGLLFGFAFWTIARSLGDLPIKHYVSISGYGIMLLFLSNQASGLNIAPYPPFGMSSISYLPSASYFILVGIYTAAISVAQDTKLRKEIRRSVETHTDLLDRIGASQLEQQIHQRIEGLSGIVADSEESIDTLPSDEEIRDYIDQVINEVRQKDGE